MCSVANLKNICFWKLWKLKQLNFMQTEHICFRAELLWRELGRNMRVCPKCEIASGSDEKANTLFCLAADATRKVVNKTVFENVLRSRARGLPQFGARIAAPRKTALAAPGCCSWFRNNGKQYVFQVFDPPGTGALRASDATSFSAAAPENGPF